MVPAAEVTRLLSHLKVRSISAEEKRSMQRRESVTCCFNPVQSMAYCIRERWERYLNPDWTPHPDQEDTMSQMSWQIIGRKRNLGAVLTIWVGRSGGAQTRRSTATRSKISGVDWKLKGVLCRFWEKNVDLMILCSHFVHDKLTSVLERTLDQGQDSGISLQRLKPPQ